MKTYQRQITNVKKIKQILMNEFKQIQFDVNSFREIIQLIEL